MLRRGPSACGGLIARMARRRASWPAPPARLLTSSDQSPQEPHAAARASSIAMLPPAALDVHVADAVARYLDAPDDERLDAAAALASLGAAVAPTLLLALAASPRALALLHDLRVRCAARREDLRVLDDAVTAALRVAYSPAFTRTEQLALGAGAPPHVRALAYAAQRSETVHAAPAAAARRKYGPRRMVHATAHACAPGDLLAVLYTAVLPGMPASMAQIDAESGGEPDAVAGRWLLEPGLASAAADADADAAGGAAVGALVPPTTAAFYSVSSPHAGARGLRLGTRIIYDVAGDVARRAPALTTFCTLSPVPGFVAWLRAEAAAGALALPAAEAADVHDAAGAVGGELAGGEAPHVLAALLADGRWFAAPAARVALRRPLLRLARAYLLAPRGGGDARRHGGAGGQPACAVAHFHLGNGARMARLCWAADASPAGVARSASVMVNYVYSTTGAAGLAHTMRARAAAYAAAPGRVLSEQDPEVAGGAE